MTGQFRDYINYIIYDDGRIYSKTRKKFMTNKIMKDGYVRMELYKDKQVNQYDENMVLIKTWESIIEIYRTLGYHRHTISNACKNNTLYKNCFWKINTTSND